MNEKQDVREAIMALSESIDYASKLLRESAKNGDPHVAINDFALVKFFEGTAKTLTEFDKILVQKLNDKEKK